MITHKTMEYVMMAALVIAFPSLIFLFSFSVVVNYIYGAIPMLATLILLILTIYVPSVILDAFVTEWRG